jgi:hypothetical protein
LISGGTVVPVPFLVGEAGFCSSFLVPSEPFVKEAKKAANISEPFKNQVVRLDVYDKTNKLPLQASWVLFEGLP